jgi:4'-phosphopantetheinyl transferase
MDRIHTPDYFQGIYIWKIDLFNTPINHTNEIFQVLSPQEQAQAKSYIQLKHQHQFIQVRTTLRLLLSQYFQCLPEEICFQTNAYGKPFLHKKFLSSSQPLTFNVSHAKDFALIALSEIGEIGIDIEYCDPNLNIHTLADFVLTHLEYQSILNSSCPSCLFFQHWVGKESFLKALGLGIGEHLKSIALFPTESQRYRIVLINKINELIHPYFTYQIEAPIGYVAALTILVDS